MTSKHWLRPGLGLLLLAALIASSTSSSAVALGQNDARGSAFCSSLSTRADALQHRLDGRLSALESTWQTQNQKRQVLVTSQDDKVQQLRASIDAERAQNIEAIRAKANSDSERRQAVDAYAAALADAVQTRRQTVDAARSNFRNGIQTLMQQRQASVSGQIQALGITAQDSYSVAKNGCNDEAPVATIRVTLLQSLASARQHFELNRVAADEDIQTEVGQLIAARQATVKAADVAFQASSAGARQALEIQLAATH